MSSLAARADTTAAEVLGLREQLAQAAGQPEEEGEGVKLESNTALPSGGKEEVDVSAEGEEAESHRQSEVSSLLRGMKVKSE